MKDKQQRKIKKNLAEENEEESGKFHSMEKEFGEEKA